MIVIESDKIEIDHCIACKGVWLDSGELELLLAADSQATMALFNSINPSKEKSLKCPRCSRRMNKLQYNGRNAIIIDSCRNAHGLWFDGGEFEELLRLKNISKENRIFDLLRGIFIKRKKGE
jgi:hypothetical protein